MTAQRISGWPVWQVVWAVGIVSTAALLVVGATSALETTTVQNCPGVPTPTGANGVLGVLCPSPTTVTTHPHELRGLFFIVIAAVWAIATILLARSYTPRRG
jgi:hypothetical protein